MQSIILFGVIWGLLILTDDTYVPLVSLSIVSVKSRTGTFSTFLGTEHRNTSKIALKSGVTAKRAE